MRQDMPRKKSGKVEQPRDQAGNGSAVTCTDANPLENPDFRHVIHHFLTTPPAKHTPLGDTAQAQRRTRERSQKAR
jgi:hypothetical protein